jgi:hypothetical protein
VDLAPALVRGCTRAGGVAMGWLVHTTKILMFEIGDDDYVEEPLALEELIARVRSIIRSRKHAGAHA